MIGKGILRERFQPRTCSGKKSPKTGQVKGNLKNIVLIDIDSDQVDDLVIIDFPDFLRQKLHGSGVPSTDRKRKHQSVISIDDDESDDANHPGIIAEGGGELNTDASSSKRFPTNTDVNDCHVVYESDSVSHLSKSRQTYSDKATARSCYGLDGSESESSESDSSDCELMEVREQWEKASVKRKWHVFNDQAHHDDHASSSFFHSSIYTNFDVENREEQHAGSHVYSGASNSKCVKENGTSFSVAGGGQVDGINFGTGTENPCKESDQNVDQVNFKSCSSESFEEMQALHRSSEFEHGARTRSGDISPGSQYENYNFSNGGSGASRFRTEPGGKEYNFMDLSQKARERQVNNDGSGLMKDDSFCEVNYNSASFDERHVNCDGLVSQKSCDSQLNYGLGAEEEFQNVLENSFFHRPESLGKTRVCSTVRAEANADPKVTYKSNLLYNDSPDKQDRSCLVESKNSSVVVDDLHTKEGGGITASDERDIINEREKLKETDEYKRAIEEEWASRQQQLQLQAEEAQRLRKRRRAESMRLLDMQRRQKERIEEVRESQKKDEEFMIMKEHMRVKIRKGLDQLEMQCHDMTSLLRGLGIQVGGGFNPLPNEVHAAYKRALLKFHPDRASKTDIREQVEAEEKFKLISRMKEKFSLTFY